MTYFPMGDDAVPSFNSTKYPGICKPSNQETLDLVYDLQGQLNRIAHMRKTSKIAVDGDIGPATIKMMAAQLGLNASIITCDYVSTRLVGFIASAKRIADALKAPPSVPGPKPASPPVLVLPTGEELAARPPAESAGFSLAALTNMSTPMMIGLAALTVGIVYYLLKKKPKSNPSRYGTQPRPRSRKKGRATAARAARRRYTYLVDQYGNRHKVAVNPVYGTQPRPRSRKKGRATAARAARRRYTYLVDQYGNRHKVAVNPVRR